MASIWLLLYHIYTSSVTTSYFFVEVAKLLQITPDIQKTNFGICGTAF